MTGRSLFALSRDLGAVWLTALMMVIYFLSLRLRALASVSVALLVGTRSVSGVLGRDHGAGHRDRRLSRVPYS